MCRAVSALPDQKVREIPGHRDDLPEAHQSFLHAANDDGRTVASMRRGSARSSAAASAGSLANMLCQSTAPSYHRNMTKLLEQAIKVVRRLPADSQNEIARTILHLAGSDAEVELIDPAHLEAVLEGLAQAKRREFATDDEVEAAFRRFDR